MIQYYCFFPLLKLCYSLIAYHSGIDRIILYLRNMVDFYSVLVPRLYQASTFWWVVCMRFFICHPLSWAEHIYTVCICGQRKSAWLCPCIDPSCGFPIYSENRRSKHEFAHIINHAFHMLLYKLRAKHQHALIPSCVSRVLMCIVVGKATSDLCFVYCLIFSVHYVAASIAHRCPRMILATCVSCASLKPVCRAGCFSLLLVLL